MDNENQNQDLSTVDTSASAPRFTPFTDTSPMPFGKHKGEMMQDVPASYLHWLWTEGEMKHQTKTDAVADYIYRNLNALKQEYPNGIW